MAIGRTAHFYLFAVAIIALSACNPLADLTLEENLTFADGDGPKVVLLIDDRRLPLSATNIRVRHTRFQDSFLTARFDAPLADARTFQAAILKGKGEQCSPIWHRSDIEEWPLEFPAGAECLADTRHDDADPAIQVAIVPRGSEARVYVITFET